MEGVSLPYLSLGSQLQVVSQDGNRLEFDLVDVKTYQANALLDTLLYEIPTVAIEVTYVRRNTSLLPSEQLTHRIATLPIKADPMLLEDRLDQFDEKNSLIFELKVYRPMPGETAPLGFIISADGKVYSNMLRWKPQGSQEKRFWESKFDSTIKVVNDFIHLTDLDPGHSIDLTCYAYKATSRKHRRWAAISQTMFNPSPSVKIVRDHIEEPEGLVGVCPVGVFDMEDLYKNDDTGKVEVVSERNCIRCMACVSSDLPWKDSVRVGVKPNTFTFNIESIGQLHVTTILERGLEIFKNRIIKAK